MEVKPKDKKHLRLPHEFYRIMLVSNGDEQTVALVPDEYFAQDITRLLVNHVRIRADQRFVCKLDKLRPDDAVGTDKDIEIYWNIDHVGDRR